MQKKQEVNNRLIRDKQQKSRFFHGIRMQMDKNMGQGWAEILRIHNGCVVGLIDCHLKHRFEARHTNMGIPLQLKILLSGQFQFRLAGEADQTFTARDIWFLHGPFEQAWYTQFPNENICGLSMGLPDELVELWLGSSSCAASKGLEKLVLGKTGRKHSEQQVFPLVRGSHHSSECMRITRELIYGKRQTFADNLRFESLALDLLSRILTLEEPGNISHMRRTRKIKATVDDAVDILRREWNDPPTISTLARRVGINECSLKKWFRENMNMPIGAYIRRQRMEKAREMIETGNYSILATAVFVGYSNPSHFSAAFKKNYGHLPSYYLPRSSKNSG